LTTAIEQYLAEMLRIVREMREAQTANNVRISSKAEADLVAERDRWMRAYNGLLARDHEHWTVEESQRNRMLQEELVRENLSARANMETCLVARGERDKANAERDKWRGLYLADHERFPGTLDDKSRAEIALGCEEAKRDLTAQLREAECMAENEKRMRCEIATERNRLIEEGRDLRVRITRQMDLLTKCILEKQALEKERDHWKKLYEGEHECCTGALNDKDAIEIEVARRQGELVAVMAQAAEYTQDNRALRSTLSNYREQMRDMDERNKRLTREREEARAQNAALKKDLAEEQKCRQTTHEFNKKAIAVHDRFLRWKNAVQAAKRYYMSAEPGAAVATHTELLALIEEGPDGEEEPCTNTGA
jgi:hypothetical protein